MYLPKFTVVRNYSDLNTLLGNSHFEQRPFEIDVELSDIPNGKESHTVQLFMLAKQGCENLKHLEPTIQRLMPTADCAVVGLVANRIALLHPLIINVTIIGYYFLRWLQTILLVILENFEVRICTGRARAINPRNISASCRNYRSVSKCSPSQFM